MRLIPVIISSGACGTCLEIRFCDSKVEIQFMVEVMTLIIVGIRVPLCSHSI